MALLSEAHPRASHSTCSGISASFEFFPPKTEEMEEILWASIKRLAPLCPEFVSVTYGAGGATRERTHATVARILRETTIKPAAHLTCVGAPCSEIDAIVRDYWDMGVRHIVALRGDPHGGPRHGVRAASAGLCQFDCARRGHEEDRRFRNLRLGLSRRPS